MSFTSIGSVADEHTAGIIIIGDEILSGQQRDTNSHFICTHLYNCGVKVKKISVVCDDVEIIADEIRNYSSKYKYVITAGGVGPTHDDVTYEGLAKAFDDNLHYHPLILDIVKKLFNIQDETSPGLKLAYIPEKSSLKFGKQIQFPCINVENVYVFPGSPRYLEPSFQALCKDLFSGPTKFIKKKLYINVPEELFANALTTVSKEFPHVKFGSYPVADQSDYQVIVTIESDNEHDTDIAIKRFRGLAPSNIFKNIEI
ncbi:hypothetical protein PV326_012121 [Microctonus aethiopoides]|nr:hypothetical protein PV326_012121 [Microctonus aethiopoides]